MSESYTFSIATDTANGVIDVERLEEEIYNNINISIICDGINLSETNFDVVFRSALSTSEQTELSNIVAIHSGEPLGRVRPVEASINEIPDSCDKKIDRTYIERSVSVVVPSGTTQSEATWTTPYDIILLGGDFHANENMKGDSLRVEIHFAENDIVGQLTQDTVSGEKLVHASWFDNTIWKSYNLSIMKPDSSIVDLGEITRVNLDEIYFTNALTEVIPAGSYILAYAVPIPYLYINAHPFQTLIGNSTHKGTLIPDGSTMKLIYYSSNGILEDKLVSMMVEYYV